MASAMARILGPYITLGEDSQGPLLETIRMPMPPANPGSLPQSAYESIATYLLYANGLDSTGGDNDHASSDGKGKKQLDHAGMSHSSPGAEV